MVPNLGVAYLCGCGGYTGTPGAWVWGKRCGGSLPVHHYSHLLIGRRGPVVKAGSVC